MVGKIWKLIVGHITSDSATLV